MTCQRLLYSMYKHRDCMIIMWIMRHFMCTFGLSHSCVPQPRYAAAVARAVNKANKVLGMIKRTIAYKDLKIMLNLYTTLVRPHVEYCVSVCNDTGYTVC